MVTAPSKSDVVSEPSLVPTRPLVVLGFAVHATRDYVAMQQQLRLEPCTSAARRHGGAHMPSLGKVIPSVALMACLAKGWAGFVKAFVVCSFLFLENVCSVDVLHALMHKGTEA